MDARLEIDEAARQMDRRPPPVKPEVVCGVEVSIHGPQGHTVVGGGMIVGSSGMIPRSRWIESGQRTAREGDAEAAHAERQPPEHGSDAVSTAVRW